MRFNEMPISDGTKDAIAAMGYEEATPIQTDAIPHLLDGCDVIGKAQTGTGKTAAFGIPIVESLRTAPDGVRGLVLCPTRELALQVTEVLADLARGSRIQVLPIYGGTGFEKQIQGLKQKAPLVVVACPGRLLDLHQRGDVRLDAVEELVLDEADRMLDMGFIHDMRKILKLVPRERRTALFSATLDKRVRELAKDFMRDPITVEVKAQTEAIELTEQFHVKVEKSDKQQALLSLLHIQAPSKAIVFTRTKHVAKRMAVKLDSQGWSSVALQGNMSQAQRERAMAAFRDGTARILVATDVAARGLDVPDVTHVINFDLPHEPEAYVHRIGRTGRNGQTGVSYTFVQSDEHKDWRIIQDLAGTRVPHAELQIINVPNGPDAPGKAQDAVRVEPTGGGRGGQGGRGPGGHGRGGQGGRGQGGRGGARRRTGEGGGQGGRGRQAGRPSGVQGGSRSGGPSRSGGSRPSQGGRFAN